MNSNQNLAAFKKYAIPSKVNYINWNQFNLTSPLFSNNKIIIYKNGTYLVKLYPDGTKIYTGENFESDFPDSIDVKITNNCLYGCPFCHESSIPGGKDCDADILINKLNKLPVNGIELALGGGNILLHKDIEKIISELSRKFIVNITISNKDLISESSLNILEKISYFINSIGISFTDIKEFNGSYQSRLNTTTLLGKIIVCHTILGVMSIEDFEDICRNSSRILLLGFKQFGRASKMEIHQLDEWRKAIRRIKYQMKDKYPNLILSFDNLALEQLDLKSAFIDNEWNRFYMGDEFTHSMYIDAVNGEYAPTSRSIKSERTSWDNLDIITYFKNKHVRNTN